MRVCERVARTEPTAATPELLAEARELLVAALPLIERQGCTLVGISLSGLEDADAVQLALPFDARRAVALDTAIDRVRDQFGSAAITRAVLLGQDPGLTPPLLPD